MSIYRFLTTRLMNKRGDIYLSALTFRFGKGVYKGTDVHVEIGYISCMRSHHLNAHYEI